MSTVTFFHADWLHYAIRLPNFHAGRYRVCRKSFGRRKVSAVATMDKPGKDPTLALIDQFCAITGKARAFLQLV